MTELVAADIGGTHLRLAVATVHDGAVRLSPEVVMRCADHTSLEAAWAVFAKAHSRPLPPRAAIAVACPVGEDVLRLTNSAWAIRASELAANLGLETLTVMNDFGAVAHAVDAVPAEYLRPLCGPHEPLPDAGVITIVGPGTGLGVAQLLRQDGRSLVVESEGGHIGFAPVDEFEDNLLRVLRTRLGRVSVERLVSGSGLPVIHEAMGGRAHTDDRALWTAAINGSDATAAAALERFCLCLGSVVGDIALAQGAAAVVVAGGLGLRLADQLPASGFAGRFQAKGRFERRMSAIPVKLITHPQPGLYGAAAAFLAAHGG